MPTNAFPSTVTQVDTSARFPLGYEVTVPAKGAGTSADQGEQVWIYVYNDSGADLAANIVAMRKAGTATYNVIIAATSTEPLRIVGVTQHIIANGSYGFIQKKGIGTVTCDAAVTANLGLIVDGSTAGNVTHSGGVTNANFGFTVAGRADAGTFSAHLNCQG